MSVARPPATLLRNPLKNLLKKHVIIAAGISAVAAFGYKVFVNDWRKAKYQEFYRTYDEKRHFERMAQAGVFDSVKPDMGAPKWLVDYEKEVDQAIAALKK